MEHLKDKKGVADFWRRAIAHHSNLEQAITEKDAAIFDHLTNLHCTRARLPYLKHEMTMTFSENEYFTNKELKSIALADFDTNQVKEVVGTVIDWKKD